MDCPLTNQGPYTRNVQENPANEISLYLSLSLDQSHEGLQRDASRGLRDEGPCVVEKWCFGRPVPSVETTFTRPNPFGDGTGRNAASIPVCCPCAIQSRPFGLPYGLFFTTQGPESLKI